MERRILLTEEEYNDLIKKSKEVIINNDEINYLRACENSLYFFTNPTRVCPKCGEYMLVEGLVCPGCGYDDSDNEEE